MIGLGSSNDMLSFYIPRKVVQMVKPVKETITLALIYKEGIMRRRKRWQHSVVDYGLSYICNCSSAGECGTRESFNAET
ncbi:proteasome subunit beta type-5-B-like [Raphanus sativus]|uniref:Proteasome subunit beta type-5-B-like n=1 Tax=Raphanus sativus TaxID=3726 RepID=A0A9W3CAF1_RAPSA|nr:proteasome subunit beta type-5-B-like [Raphanus sativus]